jgi:hypothetical protein
MPRITLFIIILFFSQSFGLENMRCGTLLFAENLKNPKKKMLAKAGCIPENLYGEVESRKTTNFIIYYTKTKSHAIKSNEYIDSLASYLEQAYYMHKNTLGMKNILGMRKTFHYRQNVPTGFYPIEVIDTGLLRGEEGEYSQTFGLTFPSDINKPKETEIVVENDFLYGADCSGNISKSHFISHGVDYYEEWKLILKATAFHELYHAFQSTYFNWQKDSTFWMEASAAGVEEIGVPDANDYINYLSYNFNNPGKSMESIKRGSLEEYGWAVLYLFLYSKIGPRFDSAIWNYFSEKPKDNFSMQLSKLTENAEELFHEFAKQVFYSGSRAKFSPYSSFWVDMPKWPNWNLYKTIPPSVLLPGTIDFVITSDEPNTAFARKSALQYGDSLVWVLSNLLEKKYVAPEKFAAFPNPWNPKNVKRVNFGTLPSENSSGVEIRSSNGALIERVDSFWEPKKIPAPGILYYRALPYGKNKVLIVQY